MSFPVFVFLLALLLVRTPAEVIKGEFGAKKDPDSGIDSSKSVTNDKKRNSYPFHGTIASVDFAGKTLALEGKKKNRIILITAETRFIKNGAKTTLEDAVSGGRITGTLRKNSSGQEEALTIRFVEKSI
jgi:hypothetical protein